MFTDADDLHRGSASRLAVMVNDTVDVRFNVLGLAMVEFSRTDAGAQL